LDRTLARGLERWCKAWTEVDNILVKVRRDAKRLMPDDNSDTADGGRTARKCDPRDKEEPDRAQPSNNGVDDMPSTFSKLNPGQQNRAERRRSEISDWRRSVGSTSNGSIVDGQTPENRDTTKRTSMHNSRSPRRHRQREEKNGFWSASEIY
jgi:hypothetical protein